MTRKKWYYEKEKYLVLGNDASINHIGESTLAGIAVVLLGMMYSLTASALILVWSFR